MEGLTSGQEQGAHSPYSSRTSRSEGRAAAARAPGTASAAESSAPGRCRTPHGVRQSRREVEACDARSYEVERGAARPGAGCRGPSWWSRRLHPQVHRHRARAGDRQGACGGRSPRCGRLLAIGATWPREAVRGASGGFLGRPARRGSAGSQTRPAGGFCTGGAGGRSGVHTAAGGGARRRVCRSGCRRCDASSILSLGTCGCRMVAINVTPGARTARTHRIEPLRHRRDGSRATRRPHRDNWR
mmetsp:Transcript_25376/g.57814  ORF Transcript_25376/g.57814 Transcript_25376/m.57814 type:complete len:244 (-) Transcript_25376:278-1009(-)